MRTVTDAERRSRLARNHGLHPDFRRTDAYDAATAMTVLHATEPASVHLAVRARTTDQTPAEVDAALYVDRSLVKQMAMRRTIFAVPRPLLPAVLGSAAARVAGQQRIKLIKDAEEAGLGTDGAAWLAGATERLLAAVNGTDGLTTSELRQQVPELDHTIHVPAGTWTADVPIIPRLITVLAAAGMITRGPNRAHWRRSKPAYVRLDEWLGEPLAAEPADQAWTSLIRAWLRTFGPGTERDLQWWTGSTLAIVRQALAALDAVQVGLEGGATGWLLPDDVEPVEPVGPWGALLPVLDPTTMGWKQRDFYLDPHAERMFDTAGNAGASVWWDGRIVGGWIQDADERVVIIPAEPLSKTAEKALQREADALTAWVEHQRVSTIYSAPLHREAVSLHRPS